MTNLAVSAILAGFAAVYLAFVVKLGRRTKDLEAPGGGRHIFSKNNMAWFRITIGFYIFVILMLIGLRAYAAMFPPSLQEL